jgi:hypothetical protein
VAGHGYLGCCSIRDLALGSDSKTIPDAPRNTLI